jgi:CMP-2-keto-3-deoxyoctulosonic acid synthetase
MDLPQRAWQILKPWKVRISSMLKKLEQLRWLQNHMVITLVEAENEAMGVDVPEDVAAVENFLKSK